MKTYLIGMYGYPGSGKTYFAKHLCERNNWFHLSSDRIRLKMFSEPRYTKAEHQTVFGFMDWLAEELLSKGMSVVYDANFNFKASREKLSKIADKTSAQYHLVQIETPKDIALQRIKERHEQSTLAEKDIYRPISKQVFEELRDEMEVPKSDEPLVTIDGKQSFDKQINSFKSQLKF